MVTPFDQFMSMDNGPTQEEEPKQEQAPGQKEEPEQEEPEQKEEPAPQAAQTEEAKEVRRKPRGLIEFKKPPEQAREIALNKIVRDSLSYGINRSNIAYAVFALRQKARELKEANGGKSIGKTDEDLLNLVEEKAMAIAVKIKDNLAGQENNAVRIVREEMAEHRRSPEEDKYKD